MKQIYKYLFALGLVLCMSAGAMAQSVITTNGVRVSDINIVHHASRMNVDMLMDVSDLHVRSNYSLQITPVLTNGEQMVQLPPVVIDGRRRSIVHERTQSDMYESIKTYVRRHNNKEQVVDYDADIPYEGWMQDSELVLREEWCACHDMPLSEELIAVASAIPVSEQVATNTTSSQAIVQDKPQPRMAYVMPHSTTTQSAQNTVEVYFAVNKSNINSSFMDNAEQMKALTSMLGQGGVSKIHLMGYASPEGPYEFNRTLAAKRAEAVKRYLDDHNLSNQITITTDSSPANWTEVKHLLSESFIENWRDIVAIIDDDAISPANKNSTIKAKYPVAYDFMLCTWYPKLRLTYLSLDGASKQHAVEQVKSMMQSNPEQLSLEDIYMVAMTYERGSKEWDEIIIFAVEAYPQSPEARLNAANVAMANGDYAKAEKYLQGLPSTMPQALNSRGILAMAQGRYSEAMMFFQQAERDGVSEASYNIALLKELI